MPVRRVLVALALALIGTACSSSARSTSAPSTSKASLPPATTTPVASSAGAAPSCGPTTTAKPGRGGGDVRPPGDIADNQAFVTYSSPDSVYTVKVPEGWARTEGPGTVFFSDKYNGIRIDVVPAPDAPTVQSSQAVEVPMLAASSACFGGAAVKSVTRTAGPAVLITYQQDGPADPVTGKVVREDVERYEFWRAGKTAVITLTSAAGSDNVDPWKTVTDSFTWR